MRAEDEYYHKIMNWNEEEFQQCHRDKYKSSRPKKTKKPSSAADKKKKTQPVNEDGFPLRLCEYEAAELRQVYRPPGYGQEADPKLPHCCDCHLKPCVTEEFHDEAKDFMFGKHYKDDMAIPATHRLCVFAQEALQADEDEVPEEAPTSQVHFRNLRTFCWGFGTVSCAILVRGLRGQRVGS